MSRSGAELLANTFCSRCFFGARSYHRVLNELSRYFSAEADSHGVWESYSYSVYKQDRWWSSITDHQSSIIMIQPYFREAAINTYYSGVGASRLVINRLLFQVHSSMATTLRSKARTRSVFAYHSSIVEMRGRKQLDQWLHNCGVRYSSSSYGRKMLPGTAVAVLEPKIRTKKQQTKLSATCYYIANIVVEATSCYV